SSLGHPVVGDVLYGAHRDLRGPGRKAASVSLPRNFLHAAALQFQHPRSGERLAFSASLPPELEDFLSTLTAGKEGHRLRRQSAPGGSRSQAGDTNDSDLV